MSDYLFVASQSPFVDNLIGMAQGDERVTEPFLRKQRIEPGKTERAREWLAELKESTRENSSEALDIWADEGLYTLSMFIEHAEDGDYLVWYIETDDLERLIEVRENSTYDLHDLEDAMLADVLESPEQASDFEVLAHGVSPERPQEFVFE